ncbi:hypothetical protein J3R30DRAFT_3738390 [Lentinula aciculospora]|uniref:Uncharacterized protein n=1 Tax=Lentinula aciculospora TaxID=153920 RepID=A0A9W9DH48_9AGAR|nr:hypothetical protein J3R30DRAFT_3738390 [Lentinula aciculospora]
MSPTTTNLLSRLVIVCLLIVSLIGSFSAAAPVELIALKRAPAKTAATEVASKPTTTSLSVGHVTPTANKVSPTTHTSSKSPTSSTIACPRSGKGGSSTGCNPSSNKCPSSETIADYLKQHTKIGPNTVFYSSPVPAAQAGAVAQQLNPQGNYFSNLITSEMQLQWLEECGPGPEQDKLTPRISKAIALASSGTAYLVIEQDKQPKSTSIWMKDEFPTLQRNEQITEVKQVIYGDGDGKGLENAKVIWTKGQQPMLPASTADE